MSNIESVEEILGQEVARALEQTLQGNWNIRQALTQDYTHRENNPPRGSEYNSRTYNTRIGTSGPFWTIVHTAEREYGIGKETEAIKKLLRYGTGALVFEFDEEKTSLSQWKRASSILDQYISGTTELVSDFHDRTKKGRGGPNEGTEQDRILWYQKTMADSLSRQLDIPQSQILHLAILLAGRRMGHRGDIAERGLNKINEKIDEFDVVTGPHKRRGHGAIVDALATEDAEEVIDQLQTDCPAVWEEFIDRHQRVAEMI